MVWAYMSRSIWLTTSPGPSRCDSLSSTRPRWAGRRLMVQAVQQAPAVQGLERPGDGPGDLQPVLRGQRAPGGDVLGQYLPLEVVGHEVGTRLVLVGVAAGADADQGGVVEVLDHAELAEKGA